MSDATTTPTKQTAVDIFNDARSKLKGIIVANENMDVIFNSLNVFYENGTPEQQTLITDAWGKITAIAAELTSHADVVTGATNAISELDEERKKAQTALEELVTALDDLDLTNDIVMDFYSNVQDDVEEQAMDYAMTQEHEELAETFSGIIREFEPANDAKVPFSRQASVRGFHAASEIQSLGDMEDADIEKRKVIYDFILLANDEPTLMQSKTTAFVKELLDLEDGAEVATRIIDVIQNNTPMTDKQKEAYQAFLQTLIEG